MIPANTEFFKINTPPSKANCPELQWPGKRPFTGTEYYSVCRRESYGKPDGTWMNRIYLGDNLYVMENLLGEFRGKIDLIIIDPPFNTGLNYKKKTAVKGRLTDTRLIKEKQYTDIWPDNEYLQFMYDRLALMRELLSDTGSIYLHCDWHTNHYLRLLMDEIFGPENFRNEIAWCYLVNQGHFANKYPPRHDTILFYAKTAVNYFNGEAVRMEASAATVKRWGAYANDRGEVPYAKLTPGMKKAAGKKEKPYLLRGGIQVDWIAAIPGINSGNSNESTGYPTQKPEKLIETFIKASSKPGGLVLDCFMGSGTTAAAAMKLGRRFIGADKHPGAVQTAVKRLLKAAEKNSRPGGHSPYTGFELFTCIDTEPPDPHSKADIVISKNKLAINNFCPGKLLQKLNRKKPANNAEWQTLVDSVMIDFNYDGEIFRPLVIDIPEKDKPVKGIYDIPENAAAIRIKITDLLSESLEIQIERKAVPP
jgi:site-specific DNA-methyltransferase (adenine-specific)/adenine-specific DNA-methyltransferase